MPVEYTQNTMNEVLVKLYKIQREYIDWFTGFVKLALYPEGLGQAAMMSVPDTLSFWLNEGDVQAVVSQDELDKLTKTHSQFNESANHYVKSLQIVGEKLSYQQFSELALYYQLFMDAIYDVNVSISAQGNVFDAFTGLKNESTLQEDLKVELERYGRNGRAFSVGLLHVINFAKVQGDGAKVITEDFIQYIAKMMKKSVRAYDDAYYIGNGEFIITVKQSDLTGGMIVLERLRDYMDEAPFDFSAYDLPAESSLLSCCVVEPMLDEEIEYLIDGMRAELREAENAGRKDILLEYFKQSPFQKYINKINNV